MVGNCVIIRLTWLSGKIANVNLSLAPEIGGGETVFVQPEVPEGYPIVLADLVDETQPWRHNSEKLTIAIMELLSG